MINGEKLFLLSETFHHFPSQNATTQTDRLPRLCLDTVAFVNPKARLEVKPEKRYFVNVLPYEWRRLSSCISRQSKSSSLILQSQMLLCKSRRVSIISPAEILPSRHSQTRANLKRGIFTAVQNVSLQYRPHYQLNWYCKVSLLTNVKYTSFLGPLHAEWTFSPEECILATPNVWKSEETHSTDGLKHPHGSSFHCNSFPT